MLVANTANPLLISRPVGAGTAPDLVRSRELSANAVLVAAFGEIDAANAPDLGGAIDRKLLGYRQLVLDLSRLEFFGAAGYSALTRLHNRCARNALNWVLVAGREVTRLLRICDPDGLMPTAPNIVSAVALLARTGASQLC